MPSRAAVLTGIGHSLPPDVVTNHDLAARLDTTDEWIRTRSGIGSRHIVRGGTSTSDLAVEAGTLALKSAGVSAVDMVVVATSTPDHPVPATAPAVATRIGLGTVPAFDLNAVCSGFLYGLATASAMITAGQAGSVLLIAADTFSTLVDPEDRATAFLFGDGAGAVVLRAGTPGEAGEVLALEMGSDGDGEDLIIVPDAATPFAMQGQAVYRQAVARMTESARTVMDRVGWGVGDVDRFVGHQANQRILDAVCDRLGLPRERAVSNLEHVGNTAAASIPLALSQAAATLRGGDRVVLSAFGGGATWGGAALTWPSLL
ncbi:3-oxoacyl-[acyl-carrier-protein] synthase III [Pseudonocardia sediminis]|uniref:Beta-ketoacyl-[acyl-carrier-protein] synthase III n=1 Tax=Pseudonocardia sediminis TaxID=1397368 RepID=A0A4Q7V5X1_PSEST|nr:beta-ketoacyl-ACP synthase III [Pseudonocardia sediminis]RZT88991.1 3-oxoacyl-[acyl-carrier-protein] synthase III [Pseudonocardia sediminis]